MLGNTTVLRMALRNNLLFATIDAPRSPSRGTAEECSFGGFLMKAYLFLIMAMLPFVVWAQGAQPDCAQKEQYSDNSCNNNTNDSPNSDNLCQHDHFRADCSGNYDIDPWLEAGTVQECRICVKVEKLNPPSVVGSCVRDICSDGMFAKTCSGAAQLSAGETYDLVVSLTYCSTANTCTNHCVGCTAHGCVRYAQTATCF